MQLSRYLCVLSCMVVLSVAAPNASASPTTQELVPATRVNAPPLLASPALQLALLDGVERVFPAEAIEQSPLQFVPLLGNAYLIGHPALYWRVEEEPAAQAVARVLESITPGCSTTVYDGPYGHGVYLTYQHES
jgi:hypothetical protein